eukprot:10246222-Ditylum_brightwellii.AAC.1
MAVPVSCNQWLLPKLKAFIVMMIQNASQMAVMGRLVYINMVLAVGKAIFKGPLGIDGFFQNS